MPDHVHLEFRLRRCDGGKPPAAAAPASTRAYFDLARAESEFERAIAEPLAGAALEAAREANPFTRPLRARES